ncbi:hypothetical protein D3C73_758320 [compost metagenome]
MDFFSHHFYGLRESESFDFHPKLDGITALTTAVTVKNLPFRCHRERRCLLRVERTQPFHILTLFSQMNVSADCVDDIMLPQDRLDDFFRNIASPGTHPNHLHLSLARK